MIQRPRLKQQIGFSFRRFHEQYRREQEERAAHHLILHTDGHLVDRHVSHQSQFCRACVAAGYLTWSQMQRAVRRYRLGMSRDGGVIFWQIDMLGQVYDGKVMYYRADCHRDHHHQPTWVSAVLSQFYECPLVEPATHCFFGLHLLDEDQQKAVAVVEAEKTAVIMSEVCPQYLWLATGGLSCLTESALFPLRRRRIMLFPDTDPTGKTYNEWYHRAKKAEWLLGHPVTVSPLLERQATPDQKKRKIDLVDYVFEK